ncbi:uncharacterized protein LOC124644624 isoform X1 [Helicoverpa zea]|uniref:uncharacterized protein LOC124644624 isoform X1 n=1 Tax=Helicoverpa zea TaxID=7113 RepID=UPI001F5872C7|nr:uncharacterized protein LOC124644624 isoform X1 [Helicoverpa zea]
MKEININIEGYNVNGICVGCLSYNRRMFYHRDIKECFRLLGNIDVPDGLEVQVCWECLVYIRSALRFKDQILQSFDFLIKYSQERTFLDSPNDFLPHCNSRVSRFITTDVESCDVVTKVSATNDKTVEIKIEDDDVKFELDTSEVKEESSDHTYADIFHEVPLLDHDLTSDEDVQLSKIKEKEEKGRKKRKDERRRDRMPANKKPRKSTRGLCDTADFEAAYHETLKGTSLRKAANMFNVNFNTLRRYKSLRKFSNQPVKMGYASNTIFSSEQELVLTSYLEKYGLIYFGLSSKIVRIYASEFSSKLGIKRPKSWVESGTAGTDWYKNFVFKNKGIEDKVKRLSSKEKVKIFYDRLWSTLSEFNFGSQNIFCVDEIGFNIEEDKNKISIINTKSGPLALKSSEVKLTYAANAAGFIIPSLFFIPPEKDVNSSILDVEIKIEDGLKITENTTFNNFLKHGIDLKNLPDWTENSDLLVFLNHFQNHLKESIGPKLLLLLENQTYHLSIDCIEFCEANDIILLVIPTYFGQNIQPLNQIFSSLKKSVSKSFNENLTNNFNKKFSIYEIPHLVGKVFSENLHLKDIVNGFKSTGIHPYNRELIVNDLEGSSTEIT